ncbi:MAG: hypothetical protein ACU0CI_08325 [Shimia sp.]
MTLGSRHIEGHLPMMETTAIVAVFICIFAALGILWLWRVGR